MASVFVKLEELNKKIERGFGGEMTQTSATAPAKAQPTGNTILYICGLGASVGYERESEYSTRRD